MMEASENVFIETSKPVRDEECGKKLQVAIFNLVSLGEWEAASSSLRSLSSRTETRLRAKQITRALIVGANDYWRCSVSVPSPSHLSWLALQLFIELFPDNKDDIPNTVERLIQFSLLLYTTRLIKDHTPEIEEWLSDYFRNHAIATGQAIPVNSIPNSVLGFLKTVLQSDPCLGHTLFQSLTIRDNPNYLHNNEAVQLLYTECIDASLGRIEGCGSDTSLQSKRGVSIEKEVEYICNCLSLIDPAPEMTKVVKSIDRILLNLVRIKDPTNSEGGERMFPSEVIYGCIIGRGSSLLVQRFQDIEEFLWVNKGEEKPPSSDECGYEYWKNKFYLSVNQKQHFLERVMEAGLQFVCSLQLENLSALMSDPLLRPLKPLLLLMGWDRNPDIGKGKLLLDMLWPHSSDAQPLLYNGCCKLAFQVGLVQWCLDKARPFIPSGPTPILQTSAGDVFQGLKSHSVLYVLHHSTPLQSLDPFEVIDILKLQPQSSLPPSRRPSPSPGGPHPPPGSPSPAAKEGVASLTPEQKRDIATYRSFCTMKLIMEAVWSSVLITQGLIVTREGSNDSDDTIVTNEDHIKPKVVRKLEYGGVASSVAMETASATITEDMYQIEVTGKLEVAKSHLSETFPLHFRLEILENIFSLLFLSNDDLNKSEQIATVTADTAKSSNSKSSGTESDVLNNAHSLTTFIRKQRGFLMNERLAFDLLNLLNDSIFELTATKFALLNSSGTDFKESSSQTSSVIISSIHPSVLQQRLARLQKCINEAKWRLQLVSSKSGLASSGIVGAEEVGVSSEESDSLSDISDTEDAGEHEEDITRRGRTRDHLRSLEGSKGSSPTSSRSRPSSRGAALTPSLATEGNSSQRVTTTNEDDSSGHCADNEDRSPVQKSKDSKRSRKYRNSRSDSSSRIRKLTPHQKGSGIICQMLASPESLLCKCLKHCNYNRAREVLKMFNMEGEVGDQLVQFAEQFEGMGQELRVGSKNNTPRPSPSSVTPSMEVITAPLPYVTTPQEQGEKGINLSVVQAAVMAAQNIAPNMDPLYRLLAPSGIQNIVFAGNKALKKNSLDLPLIVTLLDNTPSLIMLDVLTSFPIQGQTAKSIINKAVTRSKDALEALSPKLGDSHPGGRRSFQERKGGGGLERPLLGPLGLLHVLSEVSGYFTLTPPTSLVPPAPPTSIISSPHSLLSQFFFPLQIGSIQKWKEFSDAYWEARDQLQGVVDDSSTRTDVLELLTNPLYDRSKAKNMFSNVNQSMKLFPAVVGKQPGDESGRGHVQYLYHVGVYLLKFVQILMKTLGINSTATPTQVLGVIRESPTQIIGRLLFEKSISPDRLENLVSDLPHLKIVEVIVKCCCPRIPSVCPPVGRGIGTESIAVYPLNSNEGVGDQVGVVREGVVEDPCELSHKLLSKMLATMKGVCQNETGHLTASDLLKAGQSTEMRKVFQCTSQLATVSLSSLKDDSNRQLAFFCNVTNLLYAHTLMTFLQEEGTEKGRSMMGGVTLSATVFQSDKIAMVTLFSRVGYHIGELGLISLYDLHYTVLRQGLTPPKLDNKGVLLLRPPHRLQYDRWAEFMPTTPDPRVIYVISNGTMSSPTPRLLLPEHVKSELHSAERRFIRASVIADTSKAMVKVPKLISDHRDDFIPSKMHYEENNPFRGISHSALIQYLVNKLTPELSDYLKSLVKLDDKSRRGHDSKLALEIQNEDLTIGYTFPSSRHSSLEEGASPLPPRYPPKSTPTRRYKKFKSYKFTDDTILFVHQQVPILASLVSLLCPPESLPNVLDSFKSDEAFDNNLKEEETGGKEALVQTIGSQRISKPPPKAKEVKRTLSSNDESRMVITYSTPLWLDTYNMLMDLFEENTPLKRFLACRLESFKGILPWDRLIQEPLKDEGSAGTLEDPAINLRNLAVLPGQSPELSHACVFVLRKLLRNGLLKESLRFLATEPVVNNRESLQSVADIVLSGCFIAEATARKEGDQASSDETSQLSLSIIHQLTDIELACRLALTYLEVWPSDTCVKMLQRIHYHLPSSSPFVSTINDHLYRLNVYQRIIVTVQTPDDIMQEPRPSPWKHWSQLVYDSTERCDYVLDNLLKKKAFGLAREWATVHGHADRIAEKIEEEYLYDLLEGSEDESDPYTAQGVLEDLPSNIMKLKVCKQLLSRCHGLESILLVLQFLLRHLSSHLPSSEQITVYANQLLGVKALLALPHFVREQYRQLMGDPLLIIEQLLIDLKTDWITKVIKVLSEDEHSSYIDYKDIPILDPRPSVLTDDITDPFIPVIMFYAEKSLAIPSASIQSTPASSRGPSPSVPSTPYRTHEKLRSPTDPPSRYSTVPPTPRRRSNAGTDSKYTRYEPPAYPPPKEKWEPDSKARYCRVCTATYFGMFSRRHHCRRCGRVICGPCSSYSLSVEGYAGPQRACRECHNYHLLISGSTDEDGLDMEDGAEGGRGLFGSPSQYPWHLIPKDTLFNQDLRREFFYDSSPSTSLCLSITDLISDKRIRAKFLLHCCHSVSLHLVPDDHGRVNEELDSYFTIGMMENLLMNAKLRFTQAGDISGVELCDTYISRVDLLRLLIASQFTDIPSIQELTRPELARRVRDRLIGDDRFQLAMEVSTKCQLDTSAVWSAWGMSCIRVGDYSRARYHLKHCFQVNSSLSSSAASSAYLLERVVEQIINSPLSAVVQRDDWSEMFKSTMQLVDNRHDIASMDTARFKECCHYMLTYGSHSAIVGFYSNHQCWKEACLFILKNNCSVEVFVECLWVPAVKSGHLEHLEEAVRQLDPSLTRWETYMTAVCRLLSRRQLYHALYRTQLLMKDYVRAAMTCIKFYIGFTKRSTTIQDLHERRKYLQTAKQHFETSLESPQYRGRVFGRFSDDQSQASLPKNMKAQELQMHIHTVCLQLKITEMLYSSAKASGTLDKPLPVVGRGEGQEQPATLFSSGYVRGEVICNLLSSCIDVSQGFQVTFEAISAYHLPVTRVFGEASRQLALKERYQDIRLLLQCLQKSPLASNELNDEVCVAAIKVLATQSKEVQVGKQLERLIEAISNNRNKIKALIQCGKLKNAYLVAINARLPDEVQRIADVAAKAGQLGVRDICERWLQQQRGRK